MPRRCLLCVEDAAYNSARYGLRCLRHWLELQNELQEKARGIPPTARPD